VWEQHGQDAPEAALQGLAALDVAHQQGFELGREVHEAAVIVLRAAGLQPERAGVENHLPAARATTSLRIRQPKV